MNSRVGKCGTLLALMLVCSAPPALAQKAASARHASVVPATNSTTRLWATRIRKPGVPNLHRISDSLYRAAQPSAEGMRQLQGMGIKTIINLRAFHSDRDELKHAVIRREHIYFNTWHPEEEDVLKFLKLVASTNTAPVLVHCQHGADRTGTMVAIYRIVVQGWSKQEAIAEMTNGGFGYHSVWRNLIQFINELDVASLRKKAGLPAALSSAH